MRFALCLGAVTASVLMGCSTPQVVGLSATEGQELIVRDGIPALVSKKTHLVMLRPTQHVIKGSARPSFTVAVKNLGNSALEINEASISATQQIDGRTVGMSTFGYSDLVREEKTKQAWATLGTALGGLSRSMAASDAGYVNTTGTFNSYGSGGSIYGTYNSQTYDPLRAQLAQQAAQNQTNAELAQLKSEGEARLLGLQQTILKQNTVFPGEWVGGTVVFSQPESAPNGATTYVVEVLFGGEFHQFRVTQTAQ